MTLWSQHSSNQVIVQHSSDIVTCSDTRDVQVTPDICPQTPGHMPCVITCLTFIRPRVFSINSPSLSHHIDKWFDLTEFQTLAALAMAPQSSLPQFSPLEVSAPSKVRDVRGQFEYILPAFNMYLGDSVRRPSHPEAQVVRHSMVGFVFSWYFQVILHGEHAVVYGKTAVAAALDLRTRMTIRPHEDKVVVLFPDIDLERSWSLDQLR